MEIDLRIDVYDEQGEVVRTHDARVPFPDGVANRQRVACERVWFHEPDARFVGYLKGQARFERVGGTVVGSFVWDTQARPQSREHASVPVPVATSLF